MKAKTIATPEFNKMRQDQPMAYPDYGSITIRGARENNYPETKCCK